MSEKTCEVLFLCTGMRNVFSALPIRSLDRLSLQKHLDDIGRTTV